MARLAATNTIRACVFIVMARKNLPCRRRASCRGRGIDCVLAPGFEMFPKHDLEFAKTLMASLPDEHDGKPRPKGLTTACNALPLLAVAHQLWKRYRRDDSLNGALSMCVKA